MSVKLLSEHPLEFLSLKGGCAGSSESTLVKISHCWKLHVTAHFYVLNSKKAIFIFISAYCEGGCQNGGTCRSTPDGQHSCHCPRPFTGRNCETGNTDSRIASTQTNKQTKTSTNVWNIIIILYSTFEDCPLFITLKYQYVLIIA